MIILMINFEYLPIYFKSSRVLLHPKIIIPLIEISHKVFRLESYLMIQMFYCFFIFTYKPQPTGQLSMILCIIWVKSGCLSEPFYCLLPVALPLIHFTQAIIGLPTFWVCLYCFLICLDCLFKFTRVI